MMMMIMALGGIPASLILFFFLFALGAAFTLVCLIVSLCFDFCSRSRHAGLLEERSVALLESFSYEAPVGSLSGLT